MVNCVSGTPSAAAVAIAPSVACAPPASNAAMKNRLLSIRAVVMMGTPYFRCTVKPADAVLWIADLKRCSVGERWGPRLDGFAEFLDVLVALPSPRDHSGF